MCLSGGKAKVKKIISWSRFIVNPSVREPGIAGLCNSLISLALLETESTIPRGGRIRLTGS